MTKTKRDKAWYIKWISSFIIVTAMSLRGIEGMQIYDLILSIFGVAGWLCVGLLWKDRALIILNAVGLSFLFKNPFAIGCRPRSKKGINLSSLILHFFVILNFSNTLYIHLLG